MTGTLAFSGRTAIVTGAAKGLGRAHAHWLAAHGCAVIVSNRPAPDGSSSARAVVQEIVSKGGRAVAHDGPVQTPEAAAEMVRVARQHFGTPDIFVSNAGVQAFRDFGAVTLEEMDALLDINLRGVLVGLKAVWPAMVEGGYGRIVLTGSSAGLWGQVGSADYAASKAAMVGIARSLAIDVPAGADICVNVVAPTAYTPMSAGSIPAEWADYASPDHVAPVVGWLCSDRCSTSGGIYHAGAGNVRRVQILEGPVRQLSEGDIDSVMRSLTAQPEWTSSFASGAEIMPELVKAMKA
ncbi:3-oxoacyl-(acyl-carrier-protein) reductase [Sphingobium chlorophenolicum L-1]|uniref:3-oxoacyl-(Acyl-carrier-protein) reductase n=1 Tax=Sphingobium chlorophenolicum L-1 TaxID=690566 RepID=F6F125_SPHCR|nr:SDR family NAD(P)-dependent oxidoreductase [Sphingobium chlorophenolicum]AEG51241.1 3-oxoacyl-(acyl-carrier-protein) reductase [Sphingobium chlorophenolicum L-1]